MDESLSPRRKWMLENAVKAFFSEGHEKLQGQYKAVSGNHEAIGTTYDEAILRLSAILWVKENIKTWNHHDPSKN
tara:strand:+ start:227 stop:451 length:225 start_codon:yes stop_codon:yes gene_type:complete